MVNTTFHDGNVMGTAAFGGGGVTVWGCFSFNCKLGLQVLQGNLNGVAYRDNVHNEHVVPHFDNHPLADMPSDRTGLALQDNSGSRWRLTRIFQWPVISPDMNLIEHVCDFIGRKVN